MRRRTAALSAALAVLSLAAAAGCGGDDDDHDDYRSQLPPISRRLVVLGDRVEATLRAAGGTDDAALADEFGGYARALGRLRRRLDELEPPDRLAASQEALSKAMGSTRAALDEIASAARRGDAAAARAAATRLVHEAERLSEARAELTRRAGSSSER